VSTHKSTAEPKDADFERATNARVVLLLEAVAARLGLNPTDLKCLDLVAGEDTVTPGHLAELSGLTTGAVTGVLDRLEAAGLVRRELDPADRRRFVIRMVPDRQAEIAELYADLLAASKALLHRYPPDAQAAIGEFMRLRRDLIDHQIRALRDLGRDARNVIEADDATALDVDAPLGNIARGSLIFESGAARLTFHATPIPGAATRLVAEAGNSALRLNGECAPAKLFQSSFSGPRPELRVSGGTVTVRYRFRGFLQRRSATLALNPGIPWTIVIRGGLSDLVADLTRNELQALDIKGGATNFQLMLPQPRGTVRLMFKGNASSASIERPSGAALSLDLAGTVDRLRFDGRSQGLAHGKLHLESAGYGAASDRFQAVFKGNASDLSVEQRR
jgi:DNA-binding MarR family transcriptional regulator